MELLQHVDPTNLAVKQKQQDLFDVANYCKTTAEVMAMRNLGRLFNCGQQVKARLRGSTGIRFEFLARAIVVIHQGVHQQCLNFFDPTERSLDD